MTIDVRADSFLRGQVRRMVAGLLEVGLGKIDMKRPPGGARRPGAGPQRGRRLRRRASASGASSSATADERNDKEDEE